MPRNQLAILRNSNIFINMATDYNALSQKYQGFINREKAYNARLDLESVAAVDWYAQIVAVNGDVNAHFDRAVFGDAAKKEASILKRAVLLNAFEHISAMQRAYYLRALDYADYFGRQDMALADDTTNMQNTSDFLNKAVNKGTMQTSTG